VLGMRSQELLQSGRGQMLKTATIANIGNMKTMAALVMQQGEDQLDVEKRDRGIELMRPIIGDAAAETVAYNSDQKMKKNLLIRDVVEDPFGHKEFMAEDPPPDWTVADWNEVRSERNGEENFRLNIGADKFGDMVAKQLITNDNDIDKNFGHLAPPKDQLPPRTLMKMKASLKKLFLSDPADAREFASELTASNPGSERITDEGQGDKSPADKGALRQAKANELLASKAAPTWETAWGMAESLIP